MLSILLIILKVIGIIILILLGLILLIAGLILLVPVRYSIFVTYYSSKPEALFKISWLLKILRMRLEYKEELTFNIKILFFTLYSIPSSKNSVRVNDEKNCENNVWSEFSEEKEEITAERQLVSDNSLHERRSNDEKSVNSGSDSSSDNKSSGDAGNIIRHIKEKLSGIIRKLKSFLISVKEKKGLCTKEA